MKLSNNQKGFGFIGILLIVVVLAIIGFVIFTFYQNQNDKDTSQNQNSEGQTAQSDVPDINNSADLQKAEDSLNSTDLDKELDTNEIDAALSE